MANNLKTDLLIVGCGVAGLYCALNLPKDKKITVVTKNIARKSDSYLAQGGICVLRDQEDFEAFDKETNRILADDRFQEEDVDIVEFLFASDCGGEISHKTCKKIFDLIKDIDFGNKIFTYAGRSDGKDYQYFKEFLQECYSHRRKMRWY